MCALNRDSRQSQARQTVLHRQVGVTAKSVLAQPLLDSDRTRGCVLHIPRPPPHFPISPVTSKLRRVDTYFYIVPYLNNIQLHFAHDLHFPNRNRKRQTILKCCLRNTGKNILTSDT